ncbi:MAG: Fic family protein [Bryobacteraceae bacterium]|jgi:Fic family protein
MYENPAQMEPLFPSDREGALEDLALMVERESAGLGRLLVPELRPTVAELVRQMNSYYSNQIEGHHTHPLDIERALRGDYSSDPGKRALQLESRAHVEVQRLVEERVRAEPELNICSADFLRWIHREFYIRMPDEFLVVEGESGGKHAVEPGELRHRDVKVGRHVPPVHGTVQAFLARFAEFYRPERFRGLDQVIAAAASHHRLAWIHPFLDGNGRVTRLFTHAYLMRTGLAAHGLWMVSRGFARNRARYMEALVAADQARGSDLDGRGNLSDEGLRVFCRFFLETALDQIRFMGELLDLRGLEKRVVGYAESRVAFGELPGEAPQLLRAVLLRGEVGRGETPRITGRPERTARRILNQLARERLVVSDTPKGPVRLGLPAKAAAYYFPRLYPEGVEQEMASR